MRSPTAPVSADSTPPCPQGMQGFLIFDDYGHRYPEFASQMGTWVNQGKIKYREDLVDGLEHATVAFIGLLAGKNFRELVFRVATDAIS